jgi:hypothetical protein
LADFISLHDYESLAVKPMAGHNVEFILTTQPQGLDVMPHLIYPDTVRAGYIVDCDRFNSGTAADRLEKLAGLMDYLRLLTREVVKPKECLYIFAGSVDQYRYVCRQLRIDHRDHKQARYVHSEMQLPRGIPGQTLLRYGTWYESRQAPIIMDFADALGMKVRDFDDREVRYV